MNVKTWGPNLSPERLPSGQNRLTVTTWPSNRAAGLRGSSANQSRGEYVAENRGRQEP
jgi:hypothetical protein